MDFGPRSGGGSYTCRDAEMLYMLTVSKCCSGGNPPTQIQFLSSEEVFLEVPPVWALTGAPQVTCRGLACLSVEFVLVFSRNSLFSGAKLFFNFSFHGEKGKRKE